MSRYPVSSTISVLIVDDHELLRRGLKQVLSEEFDDIQFDEASDSESVAALLSKRNWDLILLDIHMPGRSGLEILKEVKSALPATPVIILSVNREEDFAVRSFKLGASAYLTKDSASDELVRAVHKVLAGGRYVTASLAERLAAAIGEDFLQAPHEALSPRELEVLRLVASGKTLNEIAEQLSLSRKTIATYRARISQKMGISSNVDLTRYAVQHSLIE